MSAKITVVVYIMICFEVGVLLIILPWTHYWEDNVFLFFITGKLDGMQTFLTSGYVRGAVTGLGVLNILAGFRDTIKFRESVQSLLALGATKATVVETVGQSSIALSDQQPPNISPQS